MSQPNQNESPSNATLALASSRRSRHGAPDPDDWPNHPVWKAFLAQQQYALLGLSILGLGILRLRRQRALSREEGGWGVGRRHIWHKQNWVAGVVVDDQDIGCTALRDSYRVGEAGVGVIHHGRVDTVVS
jgi:hypothetical protein